jgi:hypothetical protein
MNLRAALPLSLLAWAILGTGCQPVVTGGSLAGEGGGSSGDLPEACAVPDRACGEGVDGIYYGVSYCTLDEDGNERWTACCEYDVAECECPAPWAEDQEPCDTPLVLAFDHERVVFDGAIGGDFDLTREQVSAPMNWPTAATPWLALDLDQSGAIEHGGELFGSATTLGLGFAKNGFEALAALDANGDAIVDARDPGFEKLLVWRDADQDRASTASELTSASNELTAIELGYVLDRHCDARGNCEVERATFHYRDPNGAERTGSVVDVHLKRQL